MELKDTLFYKKKDFYEQFGEEELKAAFEYAKGYAAYLDDSKTERDISDAMLRLMKDRTCFVIAHRLSTVRNADNIVVVKGGDVVEQGRHEELLAYGGFYAELYNSQFEKV